MRSIMPSATTKPVDQVRGGRESSTTKTTDWKAKAFLEREGCVRMAREIELDYKPRRGQFEEDPQAWACAQAEGFGLRPTLW